MFTKTRCICCAKPTNALMVGILLCLSMSLAAAQTSMPQPVLPFVERNICPGEYCLYGTWTARKTVLVYDTWQSGRRRIAQIASKQDVVARTGLVVTERPGIIRMDRDLAEQGLEKGDTLFTYTYRGEGFSAVWFHGKFYPEFDISFARWPDGSGCGGGHCAANYTDLGNKTWWAE